MPSVGVNLPSIYHLDLARNKLAGSIPDGFVQGISNVVKLKLNDNQLSGSLPHSLALCKRLTMLRLESNMLEGQIPPQLSTLASLVEASFRDNHLTGARSWRWHYRSEAWCSLSCAQRRVSGRIRHTATRIQPSVLVRCHCRYHHTIADGARLCKQQLYWKRAQLVLVAP